MPWRGPEYPGDFPSLGHDLLDWFERYLVVPDGSGAPLTLTQEQAAFVVRFYGMNSRARYAYRRAALRRAKGWGKSPLLAAIAIAELAGPTVFDGWSSAGEPVGRPRTNAWVQIAATSEDQTDNTYAALYEMLSDAPDTCDELGIDVGLTRVFLKHRQGRLEPVTSAAGSREGQRITFAVKDETHLWTPSNGGVRLNAVLNRNLAKMGGRSVETTNAYLPGERSVAEQTHRDADNSQKGLLYDAVEAPEVDLADRPALLEALAVAYGDSYWVDLDRIVEEILDASTSEEDARRFYLNQIVPGSGKAVDPKRWAQLADVERGTPPPGARIGLGFDGSISGDATVLVGCTDDGHLFEVASWVRPRGVDAWMVPRSEVHAAVDRAFSTWSVGRMLCDPPKWWTEIEQWAARYGEETVLALDTNSERRFAPAVDRFLTAYREGSLSHADDEVLTEHLHAAHLRKSRVKDDEDDLRTLYVIVKGEDRRKIDAAVAAVLAHEAAMTMPEVEPTRVPSVMFV